MNDNNSSIPINFIGVADHVREPGQPFPIGPIDLYQLAQHKAHLVYPAVTKDYAYVFVLHIDKIDADNICKIKIRIRNEEGAELGSVNFSSIGEFNETVQADDESPGGLIIPIKKDAYSQLFYVKLDALVARPGRYVVEVSLGEDFREIGEIYFHYDPTPPLTRDQIKAIESDPRSVKIIRFDFGCKHCSKKLHTYTALEKFPNLEEEGCIWQHELGDEFECECGKTKYSLKYVKESLHGLLLKDWTSTALGISYERRYGHEQVINILREYEEKLKTEKDEKPFQLFIEKYPILLARFHAKRLFIKPNILGKFETDFALLDTRNQLILIELEKPTLKLFKKDGHPSADLMHAYGQVRDWLYEYAKHPAAVIECLKLGDEKVLAVRGVVIAGRRSNEIVGALQRHLSAPPYPEIDFLTLDDLSNSVYEISRSLI